MISASTRFFAQPREIMPIFFGFAPLEPIVNYWMTVPGAWYATG
jgi:hypothetical protein